jgi:hypothetical protein
MEVKTSRTLFHTGYRNGHHKHETKTLRHEIGQN